MPILNNSATNVSQRGIVNWFINNHEIRGSRFKTEESEILGMINVVVISSVHGNLVC